MELTPRKKAIIAEIVKAHIENGQPIGSKILATMLEGAPSSATLRNEMSDLSEMGYLIQPHTSAGRLPTAKAYRLYVSELMDKRNLSAEGKSVIDAMVENIRQDPETMLSSAAEILSELTGLPTITASGVGKGVRIKRVTLLPMGRGSAVVFVISDDGRTRSRLIRSQSVLTDGLLTRFDEIVSERVCGKDVNTLDMAYLQSIVASAGLDALALAPIFSTVFDMAGELSVVRINMGGTANLFSLCSTDRQARKILDLLKTGETVENIFSAIKEPVGVVFGGDTLYDELEPTGMVIASLGGAEGLGRIAVIGPTRMSYETILPSVEYLAEKIGNILNEVLKGLEE